MAVTRILASQIKDDDLTDVDVSSNNKDGSAATPSMRTLGTGALQAAAGNHVHSASSITSGTMATARLGSGTANSTTFLRGDQTYAAPASGGPSLGLVVAISQMNVIA